MREQPAGQDLLDVARQVLREELLPHLSGEQRLSALMIANAMGIAARQYADGDASARAELAGLRRLLTHRNADVWPGRTHDDTRYMHDTTDTTQELTAALLALNRVLATSIRQGWADPGTPQRSAILSHLREVARQRVLESHPAYLNGSA